MAYTMSIASNIGSALKNLGKSEEIIRIAGEEILSATGLFVMSRSKERSPVKEGTLRSSITMASPLSAKGRAVTVGTNVVYANYQEMGARRDGSRRVRRYSKSGTGKEYMKAGYDYALSNMSQIKTIAVNKIKKSFGL